MLDRLLLTVLLGFWLATGRVTQGQEQVLPADKAPIGTPLKAPDSFVRYQLSHLQKGGQGFPPPEFQVQYARDKDDPQTISGDTVAN